MEHADQESARNDQYEGVPIRHLKAGPGGSGKKCIQPKSGRRRTSSETETQSIKRRGVSPTPTYERIRDN